LEKEEGHGGFVQFCRGIRSIVFWKLRTGAKMDTPQYINEIISDVRCIKPGWYAMDDVGNLSSGQHDPPIRNVFSIKVRSTLKPSSRQRFD